MPMPRHSRIASLLACLVAVSACSQAGGPAAPGLAAATVDAGTQPRFCPRITLLDGTAILRRGEGEAQQFVASIADTTRSCRVLNGELYMEVGVAGRLVPGVAARPGQVELPIRVAVRQGSQVLYSNLGRQSVSTDPGPAQSFVYVDRNVRIPETSSRSVVIFVGFDEGAR